MARSAIETIWTPIDIALRAKNRYESPYTDVSIAATFEHESGDTHEIPGFWDGENEWRVRFAPTNPGRWEYEIESDADDDGLASEGA